MVSWPAEPHTLAKIEILRKYLDAWFPIVGSGFPRKRLYYIDGFAGPGRYSAGQLGSPLVALDSAIGAIDEGLATGHWRAGPIVCLFVEKEFSNMRSLEAELGNRPMHLRVTPRTFQGDFDTNLPTIQNDYPDSFGQSPLFVFLDPFGPTGLSFETVTAILSSRNSEVLLHFDADGATRIIEALKKGHNQSSHRSLNRVFGDEEWKTLSAGTSGQNTDFEATTRDLVDLYLRKIRTVASYAFPFQMITPPRRHDSAVGYYLIFGSNHQLGLEKMKSVMKSIGQGGRYRFSNFGSRQPLLFNPKTSKQADAALLLARFEGQRNIRWNQIMQAALNETDLISPKTVLHYLESRGSIKVYSTVPRKRRFTYPDDVLNDLRFDFQKGEEDGEEISD